MVSTLPERYYIPVIYAITSSDRMRYLARPYRKKKV